MGWFSLLKKDKQTSHEAEGAYVARAEEAGPRGRGKRGAAKSANEPVDPVLPEKKRARRRLVGAIALALAVIIGLPMVLDSEPKPLAGDIAIQIPAKDKPYSANDASARPRSGVPAEQALDQGEEIVDMSGNGSASAAPAGKPRSDSKPADGKPADGKPAQVKPTEIKPDQKPADVKPPAKPEAKPEHKPEVKPEARPEHKPDGKPEAKPEHKAEAKPAEAKPAAKPDSRPDSKPSAEVKVASARAEAKPGEDSKPQAHTDTDAERAKALLDGRTDAGRTEPAKPAKYVVQVAALATQEKIDELQDKLRAAGITSHTQKVATESGTRTRIRVGPFADKDEAAKMRDKLVKIGLSGTLIPQ